MKEIIRCSSELMDDYQKLLLADTAKKMKSEVFGGKILFFSISFANHFFVTVQQDNTVASWRRINLTQSLEKVIKGKFTVKTFDTSIAEKTLHVGVVVNKDGKDMLFLSNVTDLDNLQWREVPPPPHGESEIAEIFLSYNGKKDYLIVDTIKKRSIYIERYFISMHRLQWLPKPIAIEILPRSCSCIGRSNKERVDGIYTLDPPHNTLVYTPAYNYYDTEIAPNPISFHTAPGMKVISVQSFDAPDTCYTNLFACNDSALYIYPADAQQQDADPILLKKSDLFKDVMQLEAVTVNGEATVWCRNAGGRLFFLTCNSTDVTNPNNWNDPLIIYSDIVYFYPLENPANRKHSFFAVTASNKMILGEQSSETTLWSFRGIDLPPENQKDIIKHSVYRSRITVETQGAPAPYVTLHLAATDEGLLYVNGMARRVQAGKMIDVTTNEAGVIIVQQLVNNDINSIGFNIRHDDRQEVLTVNPGNEKLDKLLELDTAEKLREARLPQSTERLIKINDKEKLENIAGFFRHVAKQKAKIAVDGSMTPSADDVYQPENAYVLTITPYSITAQSGMEASVVLSQQNDITDFFGDVGSFFRHVWSIIKKGFEYIRMAIDEVGRFILEIAGKIFRFALDCIGKIFPVLRTVLEAIGTFIEKVIDFLKYLFNPEDIRIMKDAVCNCIKLSKDGLIDSLSQVNDEVIKQLGNLQKILEESGILKPGHKIPILHDTPNSLGAKGSDFTKGFKVTNLFLMDHLMENITNLASEFIKQPKPDQNKLNKLIATLENGLSAEVGVIHEFMKQLIDILSNMAQKPLDETIRNFLNAVSVVALDSTAIIAQTVITVVKSVVEIIYELISTPIYIPVITEILEFLGINRFSLLDLIGYAVSLLLTPILKLAFGESGYKNLNIKRVAEAKSLKELAGNSQVNELDGAARYREAYRILLCINSGITFFSIVFSSLELALSKPDTLDGKTDTENNETVSGGLKILNSINCGLALSITGIEIASSEMYTPFQEEKGKVMRIVEYVLPCCILAGRSVGLIYKLKNKSQNLSSTDGNSVGDAIGQVVIVLPSIALVILSIIKLNNTSSEKMEKDDYDIFTMVETGSVLENFNNFVEVVGGYSEDPYSKAGFVGLFAILGLSVMGFRIARGVSVE